MVHQLTAVVYPMIFLGSAGSSRHQEYDGISSCHVHLHLAKLAATRTCLKAAHSDINVINTTRLTKSFKRTD